MNWIVNQHDLFLRRVRRSDENDTLPDCGHHGDDSFQEDHFSGIPTTLCINVAFFLITVLIFSLIRKRAWGYGEINVDTSREMYYSHEASSGESPVMYQRADQELIDDEKRSKNIFKWIKLVFFLSDDAYLKKCGKSTVAYLTFQLRLLSISGCMTIISMIGPLPANIQGSLFDDAPDAYFAKTTIGNLSNQNVFIWVHVVAGCIMYACAFYFMQRFSKHEVKCEPDSVDSTLMLRGLESGITPEQLKRHFAMAYDKSEAEIEVEINRDKTKLIVLREQITKAEKSLKLALEQQERNGTRPRLKFWRKCEEVDAIEYYQVKKRAT